MTTNAGPEYFRAKEKYAQATSNSERLLCLQEMLKYAPKHKSSENLIAWITSSISKLRRDMEKQKAQEKKRGSAPSLSVKKEGIGQIAVVGMPNSGKSTLLHRLTGAEIGIAPYPFTTKKPEVAMMDYKGAKIQLVELPGLLEGAGEGVAQGTQILSVIRTADAIVLLVQNKKEQELLEKEMAKAKILVNQKKPKILVHRSKFPGITIAGKKFLKCKPEDLTSFFKSMGMFNVEIVLSEPTTIESVAQVLDESIVYKPALVMNGLDSYGIEKLKQEIFELLGKILVYTKKPGAKADLKEPLAVKKGSTIGDLAKYLHKELAKNLKHARVWGSTKFPGQRVPKNYVLKDEDLVEISI
ncbi:MAG: 50S ribosome-binding GTPase [Candidatus Diapherotrites archaeon]|nr:50S ribosome-binding GTPase [Candidatus Diapherotrites archaeon]